MWITILPTEKERTNAGQVDFTSQIAPLLPLGIISTRVAYFQKPIGHPWQATRDDLDIAGNSNTLNHRRELRK